MAFFCHPPRQSANMFSRSGVCAALSMMSLIANVSQNSCEQACKKTFLVCIELIISIHAWFSLWIVHLPFNFNCYSLIATTTVRSSNYLMANCCWVIISRKSSWKHSPSQMAPHPVKLASVENDCSLDEMIVHLILETLYLPLRHHFICQENVATTASPGWAFCDTEMVLLRESQLCSSFNKPNKKACPGRTQLHT